MEKRLFKTPEGFCDILYEDCNKKVDTETKIRNVFRSFGYLEVDTPTIEYYDLFNGRVDTLPQERMFKMFDSKGKILVLRPDITVPIMRMAFSKMENEEYPLKLCYFGNIFRNDIKSYINCEYRQAGIEIIGCFSIDADAEAISIAIKSLNVSGVSDFKIDIGQVKLFKALINEIDDDLLIGEIHKAVSDKNIQKLKELIEEKDIDDYKKEGLLKLPWMIGGIEILDDAYKIYSRAEEKEALDELKKLIDILKFRGFEKYISIDLGMVQNLNYYSSIIFRGYATEYGFSVCWGGRYDLLSQNFGKDVCATGFALGVNRIVEILNRKEGVSKLKGADYLITTWNSVLNDTAYKVADNLRDKGYIVESDLLYDRSRIMEYCKNKNIENIIKILDKDIVQIINVKTGDETKYSLNSLIG